MDGNNAQIEAITAEAKQRQVTIHIVCDLIQVLEYRFILSPGARQCRDLGGRVENGVVDAAAAGFRPCA